MTYYTATKSQSRPFLNRYATCGNCGAKIDPFVGCTAACDAAIDAEVDAIFAVE